ncbi:MAG: hypothetical protein RJB66_1478 [Pseudomonadota bacterium]|jgi:hypothetical protein
MKRRNFFRFAFITGFFGLISQMILGFIRPARAATWQKVGSAPVTSVAGKTGAVTLVASDCGAPSTNGTGASGTWSINVSGNAGTASSASALVTANTYQVSSIGVGTTAGSAGEIRATNNITAYFSDYRLKENIRPIESALAKIDQISGCYFNMNSRAQAHGFKDGSQQVGVIAQEIQKVLPEAIQLAPFDSRLNENNQYQSISGENYLTVQYEKIIPLLIEGIKELQARVGELESQRRDY